MTNAKTIDRPVITLLSVVDARGIRTSVLLRVVCLPDAGAATSVLFRHIKRSMSLCWFTGVSARAGSFCSHPMVRYEIC